MSDIPSKSKDSFDPRPVPGVPGGEPGRMGDAALHLMHAQLLSQKDEPVEGFSLVPIFLIFLFSGLIFWSGLYLANRSGGFHWNIYDDHWVKGQGEGSAAPDPMKIGARVFKAQCQQCHGPEGLGAPGTYPPLAKSPWPVGADARPISILLEGMSGPINVLGNSFNNSMPAVGAALKDKDIAAVLTYVRASFGNSGAPVDESEVADLRKELGSRAPWTPDEMLKLHPLEAPAPAAAPAPATPAAGAPAAP